jgi:hypothetical protein
MCASTIGALPNTKATNSLMLSVPVLSRSRSLFSGFLVSIFLLVGLVAVPSSTNAVTVPRNERIADTTDPVLASVQVSEYFIPGRGVVESVILGRADKFPDNLGGSALAGASKGVMLLTDGGDSARLRPEVRAEIKRVLTPRPVASSSPCQGSLVYVLGGPAAVSSSVQDTLESDGFCVRRLGGADRIETALNIKEEVQDITGDQEFLMVARSDNPVDSAAAGAFASRRKIPIALYKNIPGICDFYDQSCETIDCDERVDHSLIFAVEDSDRESVDVTSSVYMLGGYAALSMSVEDCLNNTKGDDCEGRDYLRHPCRQFEHEDAVRFAGDARDTTAVEIGKEYSWYNSDSAGASVIVVNGYIDDGEPGTTWVYALVAGALSWRENIVVVYARQDQVEKPTCDFIGDLAPPVVKVLGPTSVLSDAAFDQAVTCANLVITRDGSDVVKPVATPAALIHGRFFTVTYSEEVTAATAGDPDNYTVTQGAVYPFSYLLEVTGVTLAGNVATVTVNRPLEANDSFGVKGGRIADTATPGNLADASIIRGPDDHGFFAQIPGSGKYLQAGNYVANWKFAVPPGADPGGQCEFIIEVTRGANQVKQTATAPRTNDGCTASFPFNGTETLVTAVSLIFDGQQMTTGGFEPDRPS